MTYNAYNVLKKINNFVINTPFDDVKKCFKIEFIKKGSPNDWVDEIRRYYREFIFNITIIDGDKKKETNYTISVITTLKFLIREVENNSWLYEADIIKIVFDKYIRYLVQVNKENAYKPNNYSFYIEELNEYPELFKKLLCI